MKSIRLFIGGLAVLAMLVGQIPLSASSPEAQAEPPAKVLKPEELDTLLAPIALYPDPLLAQILPAATSPSDVVLAARYVAAKKDASKIDQQPWEESVKALARYPEVLKMMDDKLDWTTELGEAFVAQPKDVFDSVQRLRAKAQAAGNLKDSPQQVIVKEKEVIKIVPAQPDVIYVPVYQPSVVYVAQPVTVVAPVITFGAALALGIWIHNELDWHHHHVYYHHGGWHGGSYHGGGNNINIDNSTNINVGNGNGNNVGNNGSVWKPQSKPKPLPYGSANGNGFNGSNSKGQSARPNTTNNNRSSGAGAQQRPAQPAARPTNRSNPGFVNEGTKPRPSTNGSRPAATSRQAPPGRGGRN